MVYEENCSNVNGSSASWFHESTDLQRLCEGPKMVVQSRLDSAQVVGLDLSCTLI